MQAAIEIPAGSFVRIDWIQPSTLNPRKVFDQTALEELAQSIRDHGLIEPVVVRERWTVYDTMVDLVDPADPPYELIAGERRWRACKLAGLTEIPTRNLGHVDDAEALKLALVENLQRQNLDPIEEAEGYRALNKVVGLKQAQIAAAVNRSQPAIANAMRLLDLPEDVRELIRTGQLSASHGIALARWKDFPELLTSIAEYAVQSSMTSKGLENFDLYNHRFIEAGLIRLGHTARFDTAVCRKCPFGAFRNQGYQGICLKPEHFDELQAAHDADVKAAAARQIEAAGLSGEDLPRLRDLGWENYQRFGYHDHPKACTQDCPCFGRGLDLDGEIVDICLNPKRFKGLKAAETKARRKNHRQTVQERREVLERSLNANPLGAKGFALLVAGQLKRTGKSKAVKDAAESVGCSKALEDLPRYGYEWDRQTDVLTRLEALGSATLFRLGVEVLLRDELEQLAEYEGHKTPWLDFFLGDVDVFRAESEAGE
jgi:ParB/RepB/Spo0J family partition protein